MGSFLEGFIFGDSAYCVLGNAMRVRIKEKDAHRNVYEWTPDGARWYPVHRSRIRGVYPEGDAGLTSQLFNALLHSLSVTVRARYFRGRKVLEVKL